MKTEDLLALGLTEEQAQAVLALNGQAVERYKSEAGRFAQQKDRAGQASAEHSTAVLFFALWIVLRNHD